MRHNLIFVLTAVVAFLALGTTAQAAVNTAPSVEHLLSVTPAAAGVFVEGDKGAARHIQSGLVCPLVFPYLNLWHLEVFDSANGLGTDIGCDYGRQGANNQWAAKLTIYAVKADAGDTVDSAFARYQAEVRGTYPAAKVLGPVMDFKGKPPAGMENIRTEEYDIVVNGVQCQSDLVVAVKDGWVIEVRGTRLMAVSTPEALAATVGDGANPAIALIQALSTIGAK